jgi:iron complex outermembrane receptor protein
LLEDKLGLTFGVNNLLDEEPPLSLRDGGAGHQVGFDPRYTDAYGRTYYLRGEYTF